MTQLEPVTHSPKMNPCPRCDREMQRVEVSEASLVCSKPFSICLSCRQTWQDNELAEARGEGELSSQHDPAEDAREVFYLETKRGQRKGGGNAGRSRKKPTKFDQQATDDWNCGSEWAEATKSRNSEKTFEFHVRFPAGSQVVPLCQKAGVKVIDLIRAALFQEFQEMAKEAV